MAKKRGMTEAQMKAALADFNSRLNGGARKMPAEELQMFLRERSRGCGAHGRKQTRQNTVRSWD